MLMFTGREAHPVLPTLDPVTEAKFTAHAGPEKVKEFYAERAKLLYLAANDPLRYGYELEAWKLADSAMQEFRASDEGKVGEVVELDLGGNRCLVKGSMIWDPKKRAYTPIQKINFSSCVLTWNGTGDWISQMVEPSVSKGKLPCVQVATADCETFKCSQKHRVLMGDGQWKKSGDLRAGDKLFVEARRNPELKDDPERDASSPLHYLLHDANQIITTEVLKVEHIGDYECFDFHVPGYENYYYAGVCHHNSGKTERAAKLVVKMLLEKPRTNVWCCQSTETSSRQNQQSVIWKYLPPEYKMVDGKAIRRGGITKIAFTQAGGFTENTFVLPNGSQCWFKFYSMNVGSLEGAELDLAWADELITPEWVEALRYRLVTRNGLQLITFTPIEGYSKTVQMLLENARTIREVDAELLPIYDAVGQVVGHEKVPIVQEINAPPLRGRILYFHTSQNPFGNWPSMKEALKGANTETIKTRAYGVPTKAVSSQFNFKSKVHAISMNAFAELVKKYPGGTRYMLVDPCSGRNWFMTWIFCPYSGKAVVYREWPSYGHAGAYVEGVGDPGPWTTTGTGRAQRENARAAHDGYPGPAQEPFKFGLERYLAEILRVEGGETIFERWMDCRYGNAAKTEREGTTTLIEQMSDLGMDFIAMTGEKAILGVNDGSIDMINSALHYDRKKPIGEFSGELSRINEPRLVVTENCPNTLYSLENWTGKDGQHGACKDPIDNVRGFYLSDLDYIGAENLAVTGTASYY